MTAKVLARTRPSAACLQRLHLCQVLAVQRGLQVVTLPCRASSLGGLVVLPAVKQPHRRGALGSGVLDITGALHKV